MLRETAGREGYLELLGHDVENVELNQIHLMHSSSSKGYICNILVGLSLISLNISGYVERDVKLNRMILRASK